MKKQEIQSILLAMLIRFTKICDKHDIKYFLAYGSHLGAIRHNGFIPWDDDVDLFVLPEDLKKLRSLAIDDELFFYQDKRSDKKYCLLFDKILLKKSKSTIEDFDVLGENDGIFIDIFPLYYVPKNIFKRVYMLTLLHLMKYSNLLIVLSAKKYQRMLVGKLSLAVSQLVSVTKINKFVLAIQEKLLAMDHSDKVVDIELKPLRMFDAKWFDVGEKHMFADEFFNIPANSDELLRLIYGDYTQVPEDAQKLGHEDIDFSVSEDTLRKLFSKVR